MDINKILNADYLDILFEGRNKEYGGYELRKKYRRRMLVAGLISLLVIGGLFASTLIRPKESINTKMVEVNTTTLAPPPPLDPKKPPPPPPTTPPPPVKPTVKFTPPVIKKNEEVKEEDKPEPPKPEENKVVGPTNIKGSDDPNAIDPNLSNNVSGTGVKPAGPPPEQIFRSVEQMPEFPGGAEALNRYLSRNINYPQAAKEENIQGKVYIQFVVDQNGNVGDIKLMKDIGGGCGAEAVRVVKGMPKWKAGKQNGQAVKVYYTLPVTFRLQ